MHHRLTQNLLWYGVALSVLFFTLGLSAVEADDSGFFGRLFRFGSTPPASGNSPQRPNPNTARTLQFQLGHIDWLYAVCAIQLSSLSFPTAVLDRRRRPRR